MKIDNIVFYYPSKIVGGGELLFKRCAEYLVNYYKYNVYYVDYTNGFVRNQVEEDRIKFIDYNKGERTTLPHNSIVVLQLNLISEVDKKFIYDVDTSSFLFWCLHPFNLLHQVSVRKRMFMNVRSRKKLGKDLFGLIKKGVVKFMDLDSYFPNAKAFYMDIIPLDLLPNLVPFSEEDIVKDFSRVSTEYLKFTWLGRLDSEKSLTVQTYMNEIESISSDYLVSFTLIGDGPEKESLREIAKKYSYDIVFAGQMIGQQLDDYIKNNTDVGLAVGTSALEFSKRGKPAILPCIIEKVYDRDELSNYFLTSEKDDYDYNVQFVKRNSEARFSSKIEQILQDYEGTSRKCNEFVLNNQSIHGTCSKLVECIESISTLNQHEVNLLVSNISKRINKAKSLIHRLSRVKHILIGR